MPQEARKALQLAIALQLVINIDIVVIDIFYKILLKNGALLLFECVFAVCLYVCVIRYMTIYIKFGQLYKLASYYNQTPLTVYELDTKNGQKLPKFTNLTLKYDL